MRIVIDNSGYQLLNMGDVLMLQVAAARLKQLFPGAELLVPTRNPQLLTRYVDATPLDARKWRGWRNLRLIPSKYAWLPGRARDALEYIESRLHRTAPLATVRLGLFWRQVVGEETAITLEAVRAVVDADLVIASGGGYFTDEFPSHAMGVLDTLELAQAAGKPTALFGQGMGPVTNAVLLARMRDVLPHANLIALREGLAGIPLLRSLGVSDDKIVVTGDDAIEPAYAVRPDFSGNDIGVNMRLARYSSLNAKDANEVAGILRAAARRYRTFLRPVPINWSEDSDSDLSSSKLLLGSLPLDAVLPQQRTPAAMIRQVASCRLVVTGSYHAGVFALAQGIPVVAILRSQYYAEKFRGLADQFACACEVLSMDSSNFKAQLEAAIDRAWTMSADVRPALLESAMRQIKLSRDAYCQLHQMSGNGAKGSTPNKVTCMTAKQSQAISGS